MVNVPLQDLIFEHFVKRLIPLIKVFKVFLEIFKNNWLLKLEQQLLI